MATVMTASEYRKQWYNKNKVKVLARKAQKYANDPVYRQKLIDSAKKRAKAPAPEVPPPAEYSVNFEKAAYMLGVTVGVLRDWRRKDYFPEPYHHQQRLLFTENQVALLRTLKETFESLGVKMRFRVAQANKPVLKKAVDMVYANW